MLRIHQATPAQTAWTRIRLLYVKSPSPADTVVPSVGSDGTDWLSVASPGSVGEAGTAPDARVGSEPAVSSSAPLWLTLGVASPAVTCALSMLPFTSVAVGATPLVGPPLTGVRGGSIGAVSSVNAAERSRYLPSNRIGQCGEYQPCNRHSASGGLSLPLGMLTFRPWRPGCAAPDPHLARPCPGSWARTHRSSADLPPVAAGTPYPSLCTHSGARAVVPRSRPRARRSGSLSSTRERRAVDRTSRPTGLCCSRSRRGWAGLSTELRGATASNSHQSWAS